MYLASCATVPVESGDPPPRRHRPLPRVVIILVHVQHVVLKYTSHPRIYSPLSVPQTWRLVLGLGWQLYGWTAISSEFARFFEGIRCRSYGQGRHCVLHWCWPGGMIDDLGLRDCSCDCQIYSDKWHNRFWLSLRNIRMPGRGYQTSWNNQHFPSPKCDNLVIWPRYFHYLWADWSLVHRLANPGKVDYDAVEDSPWWPATRQTPIISSSLFSD